MLNACVCVCVSCRWSIAEGRPKQTVLLSDCSLTSLAVPIIETGIDVFVTGEASHEHSASPFRLLDLVTNTVKADVDLSGSQFGQVRIDRPLPFFTCNQSQCTMQHDIRGFSVRAALCGQALRLGL